MLSKASSAHCHSGLASSSSSSSQSCTRRYHRFRPSFPASITLLSIALLYVFTQSASSMVDAAARPLNAIARRDKFWNCNFNQNACHFRNQYNLARFSRYYNPSKPFYGYSSVLVLDLANRATRRFPGARLISHYFPANYTNACLFLSYLMTGHSPRAFYVIQQDKENKCIYADDEYDPNDAANRRGEWKQIQLQLDLTDGDPRFFIEAQYDPEIDPQNFKRGYIALQTFAFGYGNCERPTPNRCRSELDTVERPPTPN